MANGESKICFEVGRLCFMLVLKATYLGGSSIQVGVRRARLQKDNLQLAGAEPHSGCWLVVTRTYLCIKKFHFTKSIDHWNLLLPKQEPSMFWDSVADFWSLEDVVFVDGLWLLCYFLVVIAVVLFVGCLLSLSIVFVLIVFVVLLKYCLLLLLLLLFWSSSSLDSLIKVDLVKWMLKSKCSAQAGFGEGQGSRRFFKVLFPPSGNSGKWRV